MLFVVLYLFAWSGVANGQTDSTCDASSLGLDCSMELSDFFTLHWTVSDTDIQIACEGSTTGWVGFAFAEMENMMSPADFVVGYVADGEATVVPYRSDVRSITTNDLDNTVTLTDTSGTEEDDVTAIYFTRSTLDGTVPIDLTAPVAVNYAVGMEDELAYHGAETRGSAMISFM